MSCRRRRISPQVPVGIVDRAERALDSLERVLRQVNDRGRMSVLEQSFDGIGRVLDAARVLVRAPVVDESTDLDGVVDRGTVGGHVRARGCLLGGLHQQPPPQTLVLLGLVGHQVDESIRAESSQIRSNVVHRRGRFHRPLASLLVMASDPRDSCRDAMLAEGAVTTDWATARVLQLGAIEPESHLISIRSLNSRGDGVRLLGEGTDLPARDVIPAACERRCTREPSKRAAIDYLSEPAVFSPRSRRRLCASFHDSCRVERIRPGTCLALIEKAGRRRQRGRDASFP
jgi:hypothetical protein